MSYAVETGPGGIGSEILGALLNTTSAMRVVLAISEFVSKVRAKQCPCPKRVLHTQNNLEGVQGNEICVGWLSTCVRVRL